MPAPTPLASRRRGISAETSGAITGEEGRSLLRAGLLRAGLLRAGLLRAGHTRAGSGWSVSCSW